MNKERKDTINKYLLGVRSGDEHCLELLYEEISPTIRYIALKYLRNDFDADDLVQDFWADIHNIAAGFIFLQNAFSYLSKVMTRRAINRYKSLNRQKQKIVGYVDYESVKQYITNMEQMEINDAVEAAMKKLTETEKIIIQLTYFEEKKVREIAKELKISKSQVSKLKIGAIEKMKLEMDDFFVDKDEV